MKKFRVLLSIFLFALLLIASGCNTSGSSNEKSNSQTNHSSKKSAYPVSLKDATGTQITLDKQPRRIVSLVPSNTEIVFAIGEGSHVVGVTNNDDYPTQVKGIDKVGAMPLNIEKIISLKPDLVLAQEINDPKAIDQLRKAGLNVFVVKNPLSIDGVYQSITTLGKLTGATEKSQKVNQNMKDTFNRIKEKVSKRPHASTEKSVWVEISGPPEIYTTGNGTFMNELLKMVQAQNVAGELKGYPKVSEEQAVAYNPDVIILAYGDKKTIKQVENRPAWQKVPAVKNEQVYIIDTNLVSRPGPRLAKGAVELAKKIYPDAFK